MCINIKKPKAKIRATFHLMKCLFGAVPVVVF